MRSRPPLKSGHIVRFALLGTHLTIARALVSIKRFDITLRERSERYAHFLKGAVSAQRAGGFRKAKVVIVSRNSFFRYADIQVLASQQKTQKEA